MTHELAFEMAIGIAALCGAATGRIFALEAEDRRTAVLAAAYCGTGAGILSAPLFAFVLGLLARLLDGHTPAGAAIARAVEATGPALAWGAAAGAGGGLLVGALVALFKRRASR